MNDSHHNLPDTEQRVVQQVLDEQVFVSGVVLIGDKIWAIYGSIPYDGNVIAAEFDNRADAESAFGQIAALQQGTAVRVGQIAATPALPGQGSTRQL